MDILEVVDVLSRINGCTFASVDSVTMPDKVVRKVTTAARVILFTNQKTSGYDNMVRRRLEQAGKNPDDFSLSDLPWGERVPGTPLIQHKGEYYLQCILLHEGVSEYYLGTGTIPVDPRYLALKERRSNQGLVPPVIVNTYKLDSITAIRVLGEEYV